MAKSTKPKSSKKSDHPEKSTTSKKSTKATTASPVAVAAPPPAHESTGSAGHERRGTERRKVQRRRQIDPTTCERDYSAEEIEFMRAMDEYKRASGRMFPTCSEILEVFRGLGYVRPADQTQSDAGIAGEADGAADQTPPVIAPIMENPGAAASYVDSE